MPLLTSAQIQEFKEEGVLAIKGFYDLDNYIVPIQSAIWKIIQILLDKYNIDVERKPFSPDTFDFGYK